MDRVNLIRSLFDNTGIGLEIGPSYSPIMPKNEGFRIEIVDHVATEVLRAKYSNEPGVDPSRIEAVDYVWEGQSLVELTGRIHYYDFVIASHVVEHTPDLVGFLKGCEAVLKSSGVLVLAVPDKRRCFDVFRPLSTTGTILQAHLEKRIVHAPATAFDHVAYFATLSGSGGWIAGSPGALSLEHKLDFARAIFERSVTSKDYFDFHAWTFTPSTFRMIVQDLNVLNLLDLKEDRLEATPHHEFIITLSGVGQGCNLSRGELLLLTQRELAEFPSNSTA